MFIGLTGGIGSGKTVACQLFQNFGAGVFDADEIGRELVAPGKSALISIQKQFGKAFIAPDGSLNRPKLRQKIFYDRQARKQLEEILHPEIYKEMLQRAAMSKAMYCLLSIPLLIEARQYYQLNRILVIDCKKNLQVKRVVSRDGDKRLGAHRVMAAQISRKRRLQYADDIIDNSGNLSHLTQQVAILHKFYLKIHADKSYF